MFYETPGTRRPRGDLKSRLNFRIPDDLITAGSGVACGSAGPEGARVCRPRQAPLGLCEACTGTPASRPSSPPHGSSLARAGAGPVGCPPQPHLSFPRKCFPQTLPDAPGWASSPPEVTSEPGHLGDRGQVPTSSSCADPTPMLPLLPSAPSSPEAPDRPSPSAATPQTTQVVSPGGPPPAAPPGNSSPRPPRPHKPGVLCHCLSVPLASELALLWLRPAFFLCPRAPNPCPHQVSSHFSLRRPVVLGGVHMGLFSGPPDVVMAQDPPPRTPTGSVNLLKREPESPLPTPRLRSLFLFPILHLARHLCLPLSPWVPWPDLCAFVQRLHPGFQLRGCAGHQCRQAPAFHQEYRPAFLLPAVCTPCIVPALPSPVSNCQDSPETPDPWARTSHTPHQASSICSRPGPADLPPPPGLILPLALCVSLCLYPSYLSRSLPPVCPRHLIYCKIDIITTLKDIFKGEQFAHGSTHTQRLRSCVHVLSSPGW